LPGGSIWRCQRILERRMERQPGAPIIGAVMDADKDDLVALLLRKIIPPVPRLELDRRSLATDVLINPVGVNQVVVSKASRITKCERRVQHRPTDRAPDIYNAKPVFEQLLGVRSQMVAHPSRRRIDGMVIMDPARRLRQIGAPSVAHIMVE